MSRTTGALTLVSNFEPQYRKPFDARTVVTSFEDLSNPETWLLLNSTNTKVNIAYNGMPVAVVDTTNPEHNGLYILFDPNWTSVRTSPSVAAANWIKIANSTEISAFSERIASIEATLTDVTERLEALESKESMVTYGYRTAFPKEGVAGILYVATDTAKSYAWVNGDYLCVGGDPESYAIIYGGDSEA